MTNTRLESSSFTGFVMVLLMLLVIGISIVYFYVVQSFFFVPAALTSFELIASLLLLAFSRQYLFTAVYLTLLSIHTLFAVAPAYHLSLKSLDIWLMSLLGLPQQEKLLGIIVVIAFTIFTAYLAIQISRRSQSLSKTVSLVVGFVLLGFIVDRFVEPRVERNLIDSDIVSLAKVYKASKVDIALTSKLEGDKLESASEILFDAIGDSTPLPNKILLVVVESLGLGNEQLNKLQYIDLIESKLRQNQRVINYFEVPFKGSTVPGEYRELCQKFTERPILFIPESTQVNCLPNLLAQSGYKTSAYHGFGGGFFDRVRLYREFGFSSVFFANTLKTSLNLTDTCGHLIFEGLCDYDVASAVGRQLSSGDSSEFVYWLTLNGHQPTLSSPKRGDYKSCSSMRLAENQICWTVQYAQVVVNSVINIAASSPDMAIIIVGDHSPGTQKNTFSSDLVPAITIWPEG